MDLNSFNTTHPEAPTPDLLAEEAEMMVRAVAVPAPSQQSAAEPSELQLALANLVAAEDRVIAAIAANPKEAVSRYVDIRVTDHGWRVDRALQAALYTPDSFEHLQ